MKDFKHKQQGFTLLELLVSMMVVMVVGSIMLVVFFTALRGTNESKTLIATRQTGNYALSQIGKTIRQAERIEGFQACLDEGTPQESLRVVSSLDQETTEFVCRPDIHNIASVSATTGKEYLLLDTTSDVRLGPCSFTCGVKPGSSLPYVRVRFILDPSGTTDETNSETDDFEFSSVLLLRNAVAE